jgi:putative DNA methylase
MTRPRVLIEDWLPIEAIGAESKRERGASSALPPLYFLHVWWARRPLTTSRAAILGGRAARSGRPSGR